MFSYFPQQIADQPQQRLARVIKTLV